MSTRVTYEIVGHAAEGIQVGNVFVTRNSEFRYGPLELEPHARIVRDEIATLGKWNTLHIWRTTETKVKELVDQ